MPFVSLAEFEERFFGKITNFSNATPAASFATHNTMNVSTINLKALNFGIGVDYLPDGIRQTAGGTEKLYFQEMAVEWVLLFDFTRRSPLIFTPY